MEKINRDDIDFFTERKNTKLWKDYYSHKNKSIRDLIDLKKNMKLAHDLSVLLRDNPNDLELIHSKEVVMKYCFEKYKNIKKEDLEVEESEKKINNIKPVKKVINNINDSDGRTKKIHEDASLILKRYYETEEN